MSGSLVRCSWPGEDPLYVAYHDEEWGVPERDGRALWEKLVLDVVGEIALGQNSGIEVDQVLAEVVRRGPAADEGKRDTRKQRARRALLSLCEGDEAPFFLENDCLAVL